jgi:hypothetical protein
MKMKTDGDEYKREEKGTILYNVDQPKPAPVTTRTTTHLREGETVTTVKAGQLPEVKQETKTEVVARKPVAKKAVAKKSYAAKKKPVATKSKLAQRKPATKRAVAAKPKAKTTTVAKTTLTTTPVTPVIVRDTVFISRVDTVYSVMERDVFTGYSSENTIPLTGDFTELKIKKEDDELNLKIEYEDGSEVKKTFSNTEDLNLYMKSDLERRDTETMTDY